MSRNIPDFDPYVVLGVDKKSSSSEIKTAYRKLVLKCHPDKIQDESLRSKAVDDFQKVQESYEILSDDTRRQLYNQEIYLEALKNQLRSQKSSSNPHSSSMGTSSREFRDGRMYEERVPADAAFFTDSDEPRYSEEPTSYSHKYSDNAKRPHTKVTEEKKKAKASPHLSSSARFAKQSDREYTKAAHYDRDKVRTKERRRDASDKHERTTAAYVVSDMEDLSASETEPVYYTTRVESDSRYSQRDSVPRRSKTDSVPSYTYRSESDSEDDYVMPQYDSKLDSQQSFLKEYISRKKDPVIEVERRHRSSRHPTYDDRDRHHSARESPRHSTRSSYSSKTEATRATESSSTHTSRKSHERLSPPLQGYERERERDRPAQSMPSKSSSQRSSSSWAPPLVARAATMPHPPRPRREGLNRSESNAIPTLVNMVAGLSGDTALHSRSRPRAAERNDSGYSSGPGTPEMLQGSGSTSKINRFKVVETSDMERETIVIEPRYHNSPPPPARAERERERERSSTSSRTVKPTRTYTYEPEPEIRTVRPASVSSKSASSTRPLYREIRQSPDIIFEGKRYRQTVH